MGSGQNQNDSGGGLRFSQRLYLEDGSGSGSNKNRVKTGRKSMKTTKCQVEGCEMDLSNAKTYYLRHKVCCFHSKSSIVIVSGLHQRFCQQCSRFHLVSEFDLEKRSCRRQLASHNERRRKPQPAMALVASRYSRIAPSLYGNFNTAMMWSPAGSVMQRSGPWQTKPEGDQLKNVFSHGSSRFAMTCPETMRNNMSTDSSCALSLLSNSNPNLEQQQQQQQLQTSWQPSSGFDSRVTMAQPQPNSVHHQYLNHMAREKSNSHYVSPVLEPSQICQPADFRISNGTTMGGFELSLHHHQVLRQYMEPENTKAYDSSQHFNWSL